MTVYLKDKEATHTRMYRVHGALVDGAENLHGVFVELTAAARHADDRKNLTAAIELLAQARDLADQAWQAAAKARSEIIRQTGCDGTCSDR